LAEENENGQEKTEEPTSKRLEKSKDEGQIPRSKELGTAAMLMIGVGTLIVFGGSMAQSLMGIMRFNFSLERATIFDETLMIAHFMQTAQSAVEMIFPLLVSLLIASLVGPSILGGLILSGKALIPKPSRMNPIKGLKRMFSMNALMELFKAVSKFFLVSVLAMVILVHFQGNLLSLGTSAIQVSVSNAMEIAGWSVLAISSSLLIVAAIDVPYQLYDHRKKLKMTLQEVKDELKDTEGKPEVKGRMRQVQHELAQRRMMEAVPEADVIITNPEHFSVALKYDMEGGGAPVVLAKGVDHLAIKIREIANAHEVIIMEAPPLARAIYFTTDIEQEIPGDLYLAVAQVLAYVFQLKTYQNDGGQRPKAFDEVEVPENMQYDIDGKPQSPTS
jgi:flagellar biosynthetic protein FlhB